MPVRYGKKSKIVQVVSEGKGQEIQAFLDRAASTINKVSTVCNKELPCTVLFLNTYRFKILIQEGRERKKRIQSPPLFLEYSAVAICLNFGVVST